MKLFLRQPIFFSYSRAKEEPVHVQALITKLAMNDERIVCQFELRARKCGQTSDSRISEFTAHTVGLRYNGRYLKQIIDLRLEERTVLG